MKLKLKTKSPVHIGSGQDISPLEYYKVNNQFIRVNMESLFQDPEFSKISNQFSGSLSSNRSIQSLIAPDILKKHILYQIPYERMASQANETTVKEIIKTAGRTYIPGSSIKGAILSALFWNILSRDYNQDLQVKPRRDDPPGPVQKFIEQKLIEGEKGYSALLGYVLSRLTGSVHKGPIELDSFGKWLRVSDSNTLTPQESLMLCKVAVEGSQKQNIPVLMEVLKGSQEFSFDIQVQKIQIKPEEILEICHAYYTRVSKAEGLNLNISTSPDSALMRLGHGSGYYSMSLYLLAEDLKLLDEYLQASKTHRPITKKRINETIPLGWVEMSL